MQAKRDLVIAVGLAGHRERQMVENPLAEPVPHRKPVRGGEIDPCLPLGGGDGRGVLCQDQGHSYSFARNSHSFMQD
jgi:hypothetical protein